MWLGLVVDPFLRFHLYVVTWEITLPKLFLKFGDVGNSKGSCDRGGARER